MTRCGAVVGHLEQAVHGERDHHEEAAEGGQQPLLGPRLGLGGRRGGVRVRAGEAARRHAENQPMTGQYCYYPSTNDSPVLPVYAGHVVWAVSGRAHAGLVRDVVHPRAPHILQQGERRLDRLD